MKTERLVIRRFQPEDWLDLYEYLSQEEVVKYEPYEVLQKKKAKRKRYIVPKVQIFGQCV